MRKVAVALVALAIAFGLSSASSAVTVSGSVSVAGAEGAVRAELDLTGAVDDTTVVPAGWPVPAQANGIGPGSHLIIRRPDKTAGCTANFIWKDDGKHNGRANRRANRKAKTRLFLGSAGHCFLTDEQTTTHGRGRDTSARAVKTFVCVADCSFGGQTGFRVTGELRELGRVVYARQRSAAGAVVGHDFGLVEIPAELHDLVRPAMPVWGGPAKAGGATSAGTLACHYGAGLVVGETFPTMARAGVVERTTTHWWKARLAATFGDSGSAVNTCHVAGDGISGEAALGVLTHIGIDSGSLFGTSTSRAVRMALEDAGLRITLVSAN